MELHFGSYRIRVRERQLFGPDGLIDLDGRSVDVLRALLEKPNDLVMKDEIFSTVWPGMGVNDNTLQVHISILRKTLGSGLIETVHGRGYKYSGAPPQLVKRERTARRLCGERPLVTVMPFRILDDGDGLARFGEGLTADVVACLSRFTLLSVVHQSFHKDGNGADTGNPAADFVLTGEVRRMGPLTRIQASLNDPRTGVVAWTERYDRALSDLSSVQDELSGTMAGRIAARIETQVATRHVSGRPLTSHDHLVKGIWHFRTLTRDGQSVAEQLFREALALDPTNAEAVRWLSLRRTCQWLQARRPENLEEGLALGRTAVELDPASATCLSAWGFAQLWAEGVQPAAHSFRLAYAANPNDGNMLTDVALGHIYDGRLAEAKALLERAGHLIPFPADWLGAYASIANFTEGRYAECVPGLRRLPAGAFTLAYLMGCHGHLGDGAAASLILQQAEERGLDLLAAAGEEPFRDPAMRERLVEGVRKGLHIAG